MDLLHLRGKQHPPLAVEQLKPSSPSQPSKPINKNLHGLCLCVCVCVYAVATVTGILA